MKFVYTIVLGMMCVAAQTTETLPGQTEKKISSTSVGNENKVVILKGIGDKDVRKSIPLDKECSRGGTLEVSFDYSKENIVCKDASYIWNQLGVFVTGNHPDGKFQTLSSRPLGVGSAPEEKFAFRVVLPAGMNKLTLIFSLRKCEGKAEIRNLRIKFTPGAAAPGTKKELSARTAAQNGDDPVLLNGSADKDVRKSIPLDKECSRGGTLEVSFDYSKENIVCKDASYIWNQLGVFVTGNHPDGKFQTLSSSPLGVGSAPEEKFAFRVVLPAGMNKLTLIFSLRKCEGKAEIRNLRIKFTPKEGEELKVRMMTGKEVTLIPLERHKLNKKPLKLMDKSGLAFFDGMNPRMVYDASVPQKNQLTGEVAAFGAQGERIIFFLGVYSGKQNDGLVLTLSDLRNSGGEIIPADKFSIFRVHNWPQCGDLGYSRSYHIIPEVLLPLRSPQRMEANTSANFMFRYQIPEGLPPGVYEGTVKAAGQHGNILAKVKIQVFPFRLIPPKNEKMCYLAHVGSFGGLTEDLAMQSCRDFKLRGMEGMVLACQYGEGILKLKKTPEGLKIDSFEKGRIAADAYRKAGMTGPFILHFSDKFESAVAEALGIRLKKMTGEDAKIFPEMNRKEFQASVRQALEEVKKFIGKDLPLYIMIMDEPHWHGRMPRARWEAEQLQKAGIPSAVYIAGKGWKEFDGLCRIYIFADEETAANRMDAEYLTCEKKGGIPYHYGGTGTYAGAWGGIMPSRSLLGFSAWLRGFKGYTAWLYMPEKNDFKNLKHLSSFPSLTHLDQENRLVSTLEYEGIWEGIKDYTYLNTLDILLQKKGNSAAGIRIRKSLDRLLKDFNEKNSLVAVVNPGYSMSETAILNFTNTDANALRFLLAQWIMELEKA